MKKIINKPELVIVHKLKAGVPAVLRSVGDDATSYQGNQMHLVISIPNRNYVQNL